jgi:hypothetical protein
MGEEDSSKYARPIFAPFCRWAARRFLGIMAEPTIDDGQVPGDDPSAEEDDYDGRAGLGSLEKLHHSLRQQQNEERQCRPVRILLGITGSVAAVKGPELVCQLADAFVKSSSSSTAAAAACDHGDGGGVAAAREAVRVIDPGPGASIRVVLTRGGSHFWNLCAPEYDPPSWERLQQRLSLLQKKSGGAGGGGTEEQADCARQDEAEEIVIYGTGGQLSTIEIRRLRSHWGKTWVGSPQSLLWNAN